MAKIGLLGGSFNPPHQGHLHISNYAKKSLGLDEVWWLVSPQNPLKSSKSMLSLKKRLSLCHQLKKPPRIKISDFESGLRDWRSYYTMQALLQRYGRQHKFCWLMGSDNLALLPLWHKWRALIALVEIVILLRAPYDLQALNGKARRYYRQRQQQRIEPSLQHSLPKLTILIQPRHRLSSTSLRAGWATDIE